MLLGVVVTIWMHHTNLDKGYIYILGSMLFPALAIVGIGLLFFPFDAEKLKDKWGVENIENIFHIPGEWWIITVIAIFSGVANYILFS